MSPASARGAPVCPAVRVKVRSGTENSDLICLACASFSFFRPKTLRVCFLVNTAVGVVVVLGLFCCLWGRVQIRHTQTPCAHRLGFADVRSFASPDPS